MPHRLVNDLLEKQMDRREFLTHTGAALLAIIGITGVLNSLSGADKKNRSHGYGGSVYGGRNDSDSRTFK